MRSSRSRAVAALFVCPLLLGCFAGRPAPAPAHAQSPGHARAVAPLPNEKIAVTRPTSGASGRLDLRVERLWSENGATWATVSVRNLASFDLVKVTVACSALGAGNPHEIARHTVVAPGERPMQPGAEKIANLSLAANRPDLESVTCEARAL